MPLISEAAFHDDQLFITFSFDQIVNDLQGLLVRVCPGPDDFVRTCAVKNLIDNPIPFRDKVLSAMLEYNAPMTRCCLIADSGQRHRELLKVLAQMVTKMLQDALPQYKDDFARAQESWLDQLDASMTRRYEQLFKLDQRRSPRNGTC